MTKNDFKVLVPDVCCQELIVETGNTEGRWWGMDNDYHRILQQYGKIVIDA